MNHSVYTTKMVDWAESVTRLLDAAGLASKLEDEKFIILKPNLVEALKPPITTPVELVEALVDYLQQHVPHCRIVVGEGTGAINYDTFHCFATLGFSEMAERKNIDLTDLNFETCTKREMPECSRWPELYLPQILDTAFLLSVPVLKAHSLSDVTLTMKNMMGCAPPQHYRKGSSWGKSAFHDRIEEAIFDLNRYRTPDFTVLDATVGMAEAHLWGRHCEPPVGRLAAGWDPVAVDSYGTSLLSKRWEDVGHIRLAHEHLGRAEPLKLVHL